ncbi:MAG: DNA repair protein RecO [Mariprofundales bacterium]
MAESRDEGLLLRQIPFRESSQVLHLLTKNSGRIALMAKGIRRHGNRLRPHLAPLASLTLRWVGGTRGMGTLTDLQRGQPLLPPSHHLAGMELLALAGKLFRSGDPHGYHETLTALISMARSSDPASGSCRASWLLMQQAGFVASLDQCWSCNQPLSPQEHGYWQQTQCRCQRCHRPADNATIPLPPELRTVIHDENSVMTPQQLAICRQLIQETIQQRE